MTTDEPRRVDLTAAAADLLRRLAGQHDILLGELPVPGLDRPVPFWMSTSQYKYWKHTHLTVDVVPGRGSGFSVEAPEGVRFLIRSRLLTEAEMTHFGLI